MSEKETIQTLLQTIKENTRSNEGAIRKLEEVAKDIYTTKKYQKAIYGIVKDINGRLKESPFSKINEKLEKVIQDLIKVPQETVEATQKVIDSSQDIHRQCKKSVTDSMALYLAKVDEIGNMQTALEAMFKELILEKQKTLTERLKTWAVILGMILLIGSWIYNNFLN